jgi:hypothetical protein
MTATILRRPPSYVEGGKAVRDALRGSVMMEKGPDFDMGGSTAVALFEVHANTFVEAIICRVTAASDTGNMFCLGVSTTSSDLFIPRTPGMLLNTGIVSSRGAVSEHGRGWFTDTGDIIYAYIETAGATDDLGTVTPYIVYRVFAGEV